MFMLAPIWYIAAYLRYAPAVARHINTPIRRKVARGVLTTFESVWKALSEKEGK
jgi:hypothetical protein